MTFDSQQPLKISKSFKSVTFVINKIKVSNFVFVSTLVLKRFQNMCLMAHNGPYNLSRKIESGKIWNACLNLFAVFSLSGFACNYKTKLEIEHFLELFSNGFFFESDYFW